MSNLPYRMSSRRWPAEPSRWRNLLLRALAILITAFVVVMGLIVADLTEFDPQGRSLVRYFEVPATSVPPQIDRK